MPTIQTATNQEIFRSIAIHCLCSELNGKPLLAETLKLIFGIDKNETTLFACHKLDDSISNIRSQRFLRPIIFSNQKLIIALFTDMARSFNNQTIAHNLFTTITITFHHAHVATFMATLMLCSSLIYLRITDIA